MDRLSKKGVLLINLGTPDDCDPKSVRRYLKQFLNDPRVIDLPTIARWFLVNCLIIPRRYKKSAEAYQKIWLQSDSSIGTGSPLLVYSQAMKAGLAAELGAEYQVELGMRYGNPSIETAVEKLKGCDDLRVLPLFPQYANASTGSAIADFLNIIRKQWNIPSIRFQKDFYNHSGFIEAYASVIQKHTQNKKIDLILFSYHGLPERHINKSACIAECHRILDCPEVQEKNSYCYRAQCYATSHALAKNLGIAKKDYAVSFQSRLGRTPWIKPYTDLMLPELIKQGIQNIAIACPSFVADCLETLEEINIRAREQWKNLGGRELIFIPCLNAEPQWIKALAEMARA
jgi:ferrochelatase